MDYGHEQTDKDLKALESRLTAEYAQASKEVEAKLNKYLKKFNKRWITMKKKLDAGEITEEQFKQWKVNAIMTGKRWEQMADKLAKDYTKINQTADKETNDFTPDVYALNHNYGTYECETGAGVDTSYTMYDKDTVIELAKHEDILPKAAHDIPKDQRWNKRKVNSAIMQGILQGESIDDIAKRLRGVTSMNLKASVRNARTMTTGAENAGRIASYDRAQSGGIDVAATWMATLDHVTRDSHRKLDGEERDPKTGKFSNGLRYPGDPEGRPEEIYNCRCRVVANIKGFESDFSNMSWRVDKGLEGMSYSEWKKRRKKK